MSAHSLSNDSLLRWIQAAQAQEPVDWTAVFQSCDPLLCALCRQWPWTRHVWDDVLQEARLSLYQAILTFNPTYGTTPQTFIRLVIRRKLTTLYRYHFRQNRNALTPRLSWDMTLFNHESPYILADVVADPHQIDPGDRLIAQETQANLWHQRESLLSDFEWQVLMAFAQTTSLTVVAARLHQSRKSIDNALQRIRRKLRAASTN